MHTSVLIPASPLANVDNATPAPLSSRLRPGRSCASLRLLPHSPIWLRTVALQRSRTLGGAAAAATATATPGSRQPPSGARQLASSTTCYSPLFMMDHISHLLRANGFQGEYSEDTPKSRIKIPYLKFELFSQFIRFEMFVTMKLPPPE